MNKIYNKSEISELVLNLEKWICPIKFAYKTPQWTKYWWIIEEDRKKEWVMFAEPKLLKDTVDIYLQEIWNPDSLCLFDFGCGIGETPKSMIKELLKRWKKVYYHAFDISEIMAKQAQQNLSNLWENFNFAYTILDFETFNLTNVLIDIREKYNNIPVIGMLLWSTIWNFESMERVITNIVNSFRINDRFIFWIQKTHLSNEKKLNSMIDEYQSDKLFTFVTTTLKYFGLDVKKMTI